MDQIKENMDNIRIVVGSNPSLRQLVANNSQLAKLVSPDDALVPSPCPCQSGPYAHFVDVNMGHVVTTDMSLMASVHPELAGSHVGNNMRVKVQDAKSQQYRLTEAYNAMTEVLTHIVENVPVHIDTVEQHVHSKQSRQLFCKIARGQLRPQTGTDTSIYLDADSLHEVDTLKESLMITVLDKIASAFLFVCKHYAKSLVALRFQNGPYTHKTSDELAAMVAECSTILAGLGMPPAPSQSIPYV
jgi:hypothetical protein